MKSLYNCCRVTHRAELTNKVFELKIDLQGLRASPGQFMMLWDPGVGEIPLSISNYESGELTFIIARVGKVTNHIYENIDVGSKIYVRGPYGKGFTISGVKRCLIVSGGHGLAPLYYLTKTLVRKGCGVEAIMGFKSKREVFYVNEFRKKCDRLLVSTEDGSYGVKGLVTDVLSRMDLKSYDRVYTCGREEMMHQVVLKCVKNRVKVEASLERMIKCGLGICGSCVLDDLGLRVCRDGPVFDGVTLTNLSDFGKYWRDWSGRKVSFQVSGLTH